MRACVSVFSGEWCVMKCRVAVGSLLGLFAKIKCRVAVGLTGRTIIFESRAQKLNSLNDIGVFSHFSRSSNQIK